MTHLRALVLTEAQVRTGLGHLSRCQALLAAFSAAGVAAELWLNSDAAVQAQVHDPAIRHLDWLSEPDLLAQLAPYPLVLVDSYLAPDALLRAIARQVPVPVFLDDTVRMDYGRGVVLNGALGAETLPYPANPAITYLLGSGYTIFRPAFWDVPAYQVRETVRNVFLSFGASDTRQLLPQAIPLVREALPQAIVHIVHGASLPHKAAIAAVADAHVVRHSNLPDTAMRDLMWNCDLAVSAAGQTLQELVRVGVPTIGVCTADNQRHLLAGLQAHLHGLLVEYDRHALRESLRTPPVAVPPVWTGQETRQLALQLAQRSQSVLHDA